jgi:flagellar protein FlgJ
VTPGANGALPGAQGVVARPQSVVRELQSAVPGGAAVEARNVRDAIVAGINAGVASAGHKARTLAATSDAAGSQAGWPRSAAHSDTTKAAAAAYGARHAAAPKASAAVGTVDGGSIADAVASLPRNVQRFIERMRPHAEAAARAAGIPAELLLAQAGLETGWGRAQPHAADGSASHNLFGIKAGAGWKGAVAAASTTEYVAGALVRTVERFRSYGSYTDAFNDFARLITGNDRYAAAVQNTADPVAYARGLQRGGYATDPQYADKLVRAIRMVGSYLTPGGSTTQVAAPGRPGEAAAHVTAAARPGDATATHAAQVRVAAAVNPSRASDG